MLQNSYNYFKRCVSTISMQEERCGRRLCSCGFAQEGAGTDVVKQRELMLLTLSGRKRLFKASSSPNSVSGVSRLCN